MIGRRHILPMFGSTSCKCAYRLDVQPLGSFRGPTDSEASGLFTERRRLAPAHVLYTHGRGSCRFAPTSAHCTLPIDILGFSLSDCQSEVRGKRSHSFRMSTLHIENWTLDGFSTLATASTSRHSLQTSRPRSNARLIPTSATCTATRKRSESICAK
ncbi:hypothetical protein PYCCODRAFT_739950 [Trametes coccinea BRFM310]|uniref:Uncharacterized protein n=1 Tax=Trametes coccinea (strain BRFM310) TaxID=1353009 RepID=A0A1Y2IFI8_TRAC3|nr:hypothetical protein PYCCODRAFT_739950 [Trametes coccinea BRFM310]